MLKKEPRVLFDDGFHDPSVQLSHVDREKGTRDKRSGVKNKKEELFRDRTRDGYSQEFKKLTDEFFIDCWTTLFLSL